MAFDKASKEAARSVFLTSADWLATVLALMAAFFGPGHFTTTPSAS